MRKTGLNLSMMMCLCAFSLTAQTQKSAKLITVAEFGRHMPIGVSVNTQNKVFVSFPNADGNGDLSLGVLEKGKLLAYPDKGWNDKGGNYSGSFLRVQDLYVDADDNLWVLDSKPAPQKNIFGNTPDEETGKFKLVKINTKTNRVERVYLFAGLNKGESALNDVRVDPKRNIAYFSDPGQRAIVVMDLQTEKIRTLLKNTKYTIADNIALVYDGKEMRNKQGKPFSSDVNGIALTHDFKYLYFKPINKKQLFRIETKYLNDDSLSGADLETKVESAGEVGITHGLIADRKGDIFLTTSENYSISYITPDGTIHTLVHDPRIIWPDSIGIGSDGYLYFSCAQLQRLPDWNNGENKTEYPYRIFKVKLP